MTVRVYKSTDASAPVLNGTAGSLLAVFNACLVNGYGAKAAAGWTKPIADAANKGMFLQQIAGANNPSGMCLYMDDAAAGTGGALEARVNGFETMSALGVGTGQFPTNGQSAIGIGQLVIRKSATANATARAWTMVATGQTIYFWSETGDWVTPVGAFTFIFGDFISYKTNDPYAVHIIGRNIENNNSSTNESFAMFGGQASTTWGPSARYFGHYIARSWHGLGGSVNNGKTFDFHKFTQAMYMGWTNDTTTSMTGTVQCTSGRNNAQNLAMLSFPNPVDGSIVLSPIYLFHNFAQRGYMPGLWAVCHDRPLNHNDVLTLTAGQLNGKTLLCQSFLAYITGNDVGQIMVETSDTWS